jgi:iron complex transport system ATP-binding protein
MSSHELTLENLEVGIDGCHIVKGISLELLKGESLILMGPNGSGKSTVIKTLSGIEENNLKVSFSRFHHRGKDILSLDHKERSLLWTVVPQFPEWQKGLKVSSYLEYSRFPYFSHSGGHDPHLLEQISEGLGIHGLYRKNLEHLSGGERKRVAIAAALYQDVSLVYLDEPFQALDPLAKMELASFLKKWQKEKDLSFVIASHDFYWSHELCDKVMFLKSGELKFYGKKEETFIAKNLEDVYGVAFKWVELDEAGGFFMPLSERAL